MEQQRTEGRLVVKEVITVIHTNERLVRKAAERKSCNDLWSEKQQIQKDQREKEKN